MALQKYQLTLVILGLLPAMMAVLAGLIVVAMMISQKITPDITKEFLTSSGAILLILTVVFLIVGRLCMDIQPVQRFVDMSPLQKLYTEIATTEADVCKLMTRVDHFIQGDVGHPGIKNPSLVTEAQQSARSAAGGPLVDCSQSHTELQDLPNPDASGNYPVEILNAATDRLDRLERTLDAFTAPELQKTYENTVICKEPFADVPLTKKEPTIKELQGRLTKIQQKLRDQHKKFLAPIDEKTASLQRGEVSDCDKRRGAATQNKRGVKK
jgi:hypothetical protein